MNTHQILSELRSELGRINQAIAAVESLDLTGPARRGHRPATAARAARRERGGRHHISAAGRARITAAARARWARQRKEVAPAGKKAAPVRRMSAAGRKRLAEAAKKRWAAAKKAGRKRL